LRFELRYAAAHILIVHGCRAPKTSCLTVGQPVDLAGVLPDVLEF
jgi:hypothetical protein